MTEHRRRKRKGPVGPFFLILESTRGDQALMQDVTLAAAVGALTKA